MTYEYLMLRDKCVSWQRLRTRAICLILPSYHLNAEYCSSLASDICGYVSIIFRLNVWHVAQYSEGVHTSPKLYSR